MLRYFHQTEHDTKAKDQLPKRSWQTSRHRKSSDDNDRTIHLLYCHSHVQELTAFFPFFYFSPIQIMYLLIFQYIIFISFNEKVLQKGCFCSGPRLVVLVQRPSALQILAAKLYKLNARACAKSARGFSLFEGKSHLDPLQRGSWPEENKVRMRPQFWRIKTARDDGTAVMGPA